MISEQAIALIAPCDSDGHILLLQRGEGQHCAGLWSFPGGKVEAGESAQHAAKRELLEETGLHGTAWQQLGSSRFSYPDCQLHFTLFVCVCDRPATLQAESAYVWAAQDQLGAYPMPDANKTLIRMLNERNTLPEA